MPIRLTEEKIRQLLKQHQGQPPQHRLSDPSYVECDVFIAGSGPIGRVFSISATYARTILDWAEKNNKTTPKIVMADIGSKDGKITGGHHKNSIKYQKDIDMFVNVIKGALQPISVPTSDVFQSTLGGTAWTPALEQALVIQGHNPNQKPQMNLKASAVTRTVGGMATHWTCSCPIPNDEERVELHKVIPKLNMDSLLNEAGILLNVHSNEFDDSIRHNLVKKGLTDAFTQFPGRTFQNIPLAAERRSDNKDYVTWTGADTILGKWNDTFDLLTETRVTRVGWEDPLRENKSPVQLALVRDLNTGNDRLIVAKAFIIACGSVPTCQILWNSKISEEVLGQYLTEQSMTFCQVIMKSELISSVDPEDPRVVAHRTNHPNDPLPIPFNDLEPQSMIPYTPEFPWHVQIHRDAFSYGDVGPKADPRTVVDLRFFGKGEVKKENRIFMAPLHGTFNEWKAGVTDIYGMPQVTFEVTRTEADKQRDQRMMKDMTTIANYLGSYLPGSEPQFMASEPGLAMHVTGTFRIGNSADNSVADDQSRVHGIPNLWVGGNGCLPDATASNPTRTSVAIALKGAQSVIDYIAPLL
ncbi:pyranose 2-oxidase [Pholiota conissans]|uniref:Pyranose 2-oxidase n=1 Tax=Pholiota conissans TaxID=109636 RepID=A0A9P5YRX0_9AGAR|nr:pyranose 2-oxidase [Pholiota conissans]